MVPKKKLIHGIIRLFIILNIKSIDMHAWNWKMPIVI